MYMKKFFILLSLCALLVPCCKNRGGKADAEAEAAAREQAVADSITKAQTLMDKLAQLPEEPVFDIVTSMGTIKIKLYAKTPKHRDNFAKLALSGFYDGLLFHRVIDGFMIQGGDPDSKGAPAGQHLGRIRSGIYPHQRCSSRRPSRRCRQSPAGILRLPVLYRPESGHLRPAGRGVHRLR